MNKRKLKIIAAQASASIQFTKGVSNASWLSKRSTWSHICPLVAAQKALSWPLGKQARLMRCLVVYQRVFHPTHDPIKGQAYWCQSVLMNAVCKELYLLDKANAWDKIAIPLSFFHKGK